MLPQLHEIDEGQETLVLAVCNKMTRELKLAKVYIDQTFKNATATCEFFYVNEESLEQNLANCEKSGIDDEWIAIVGCALMKSGKYSPVLHRIWITWRTICQGLYFGRDSSISGTKR